MPRHWRPPHAAAFPVSPQVLEVVRIGNGSVFNGTKEADKVPILFASAKQTDYFLHVAVQSPAIVTSHLSGRRAHIERVAELADALQREKADWIRLPKNWAPAVVCWGPAGLLGLDLWKTAKPLAWPELLAATSGMP